MTARAGLRMAWRKVPHGARYAALSSWVVAAGLALFALDVPLSPPARPAPPVGPGSFPRAHQLQEALPPTQEPRATPKAKEKLIEISPFEQVPA